ncbi:MAG: 50S ribosomal protein L11 methyltransferase [Chloroflexota bacterium]
MRWIELSVRVDPEAVDAVANVFQENGTGGVAIHQPIDQHHALEEEPRFVGLPLIKAYLPSTEEGRGRAGRIERDLWHLQAFNLSPVGPLERAEIEEEDWANGWKEHFHPLRVGRVVIKPTWREWEPAAGDLIIQMDPGMAFGTGLHPTTRLTLIALQEHVETDMNVLDLGTGSGVLAMAAALFGAHVIALDVSEVAVDVAQCNVDANDLSGRISVEHGSIAAVAGQRFDLVLANIIASVLIELSPALAASLRPGALLLASGIIEERADAVRSAFRAAGMHLEHQTREGDWWLIPARRPV